MIKTVRLEGTTYHDLPWKFEAGTQAIAEVIGLGAAVDYLSELGMDAVRSHERELTEYAYEALSEIEGLTVYGPPPSRRAGVISFSVEGIHPTTWRPSPTATRSACAPATTAPCRS